MKPTAEQIINWGREALNKTGALIPTEWNIELLEAICSAAYEAGRKDENEACANVCVEDASLMRGGTPPQIALMDAAVAIRARREHG